MIDYLKECGISDQLIEELEDVLPDEEIRSLHGNKSSVKDIISYFDKIGITCIDKLLTDYTYIFLMRFDVIYDTFNKYDIDSLVKRINFDYNSISEIWDF